MAAIASTFVKNQLLPRVDLVALVAQYCKLTHTSSGYMCCCPFHEDHHPSMLISSKTQHFICFGCGAQGDAIDFVQRYHHVGFVEAVERLAKDVGIEVEYERQHPYAPQAPSHHHSAQPQPIAVHYTAPPEPPVDRATRLRYCALMERISEFFVEQMKRSRRAQLYLQERGLTQEVIAESGIGYAPKSYSYVQELCQSPEELKMGLELGLVREASGEGAGAAGSHDYRAFFRERVMFPLRDVTGHIVAFGARCIGDKAEGPKYLNSKESAIFKKRHELFGLYECLRANGGHPEQVIVVEGYMDVLALRQMGFSNVVAALGTAFSREHYELLQSYCDEIVLCFDGDEAGRLATDRALKLISANQLGTIKVLRLPDPEDPDSFVRKFGPDKLRELLNRARPASEYLNRQQ